MKARQCVSGRKSVILRKTANGEAVHGCFYGERWPLATPFMAFRVAKGGLPHSQKASFAAFSAVKTVRFNRVSACKTRPFARFLMSYYCTLGGWCNVKCLHCNSYVCTLQRAIFPHKKFVLPNNAVSERWEKTMCHGCLLYCCKVSAGLKAYCWTTVGRMLKKPRTPTDF